MGRGGGSISVGVDGGGGGGGDDGDRHGKMAALRKANGIQRDVIHLSRHSLENTSANRAKPNCIIVKKSSDHDVICGGRQTPRPR